MLNMAGSPDQGDKEKSEAAASTSKGPDLPPTPPGDAGLHDKGSDTDIDPGRVLDAPEYPEHRLDKEITSAWWYQSRFLSNTLGTLSALALPVATTASAYLYPSYCTATTLALVGLGKATYHAGRALWSLCTGDCLTQAVRYSAIRTGYNETTYRDYETCHAFVRDLGSELLEEGWSEWRRTLPRQQSSEPDCRPDWRLWAQCGWDARPVGLWCVPVWHVQRVD